MAVRAPFHLIKTVPRFVNSKYPAQAVDGTSQRALPSANANSTRTPKTVAYFRYSKKKGEACACAH